MPWLRGPWGRAAKIGGAVVGGLALLLAAANLIISADWVEARVAARIKEQTGRDLTVNGSAMLLFTPGPHVVITDAKITDPDAQAGSADISVAELKLDLTFSDLFSRRVDAQRVTLVRPVVTVRLGDDAKLLRWGDADGPLQKIRFARAEMGGAEPERRDVRLQDVRIEDGTVIIAYGDAEGRPEKRVEHINAALSLPTIAAPLIGQGKLDWKNQTVDFSFEVTTPADLRAKRPARLQLALDTKAIAARFDGTLATSPHLSGQGHLAAKASSIPSVLAWMRAAPDISSAIGDGELASDVSWTEGEITFSNARFALEHASGQGKAVVALKSPRPHVRAALAIDHLDLNPFLAKTGRQQPGSAPIIKGEAAPAPAAPAVTPSAAPDAQPATPAATPAAAKPAAAPPDWFSNPAEPAAEVEQEIVPPPPAVTEGAALENVASTPPPAPRVAAPAAVDADVNLNIRKTRVGHLDIGPSSLGIAFRDGVMNATLGGMDLYDGHASGTLVIDASKPVPSFTGDIRLEGVQAKPFLSDAAQFSMIAGRTKLALNVSGEGEDAEAIKASLRGNGSVLISNGSVEGIDITAFIGGLGEGEFDLRRGPDAKTAFSDLGGSFTISDGIAETHNLKMMSPLLKVMAEGTVDLARGNLDIVAHPEIVEGPEGKKGANDLAGLSVPVRIEGPLDQPRIRPEIGAAFANPESASKTMNKIGEALQKKFKGKPVGEAIGRFLGNVQIGGGRRQKRADPPQAQAEPLGPEPDQGDADAPEEKMDPDLEEILR